MKNLIFTLFLSLAFSITSFAQEINQEFFDQADRFFSSTVDNGLVKYSELKDSKVLNDLIQIVKNVDLSTAAADTKKAFYINAYNLHVINNAAQAYPSQSVQDQAGFFDSKKVEVAGEQFTLNNLEKKRLLEPFDDARLHFVLVCGALGCPPITNFAYRPSLLDQQLNKQTRIAMNNPDFIRGSGDNVSFSQIFKWYSKDFGGRKENILGFINKYKTDAIPLTTKIKYYTYDWSLNDISAKSSSNNQTASGSNNAARYIVSSTIPKGSSELKIFNNLYTQRTGSIDNLTDRATFFTTSFSYLYGLSNRFNVGVNTRYRRVRNDLLPSSPFSVLGGSEAQSSRQGITALGPQIRWAPVPKWQNFSIQSSFVFPIGSDLAGSPTQPYIDWNGATWNTQFFNDLSIGSSFSLFTEIDFLIEDIGDLSRVSTPVTLIFSYSPSSKATIYALAGYSPYWQETYDYFYQFGTGVKYQFTPNVELELLVTDFTNKDLKASGGQASTFNLGFRFNMGN